MSGEKQEFYAETVQGAVEKAAETLGSTPSDLNYSVLDEGSSGFLGIGARDARIEVEVPSAPEPASEQVPTLVSSSPADKDLEPQQPVDARVDQEPGNEDELPPSTEAGADPSEEAPSELILAVDGFATRLLEQMGFDATVDAYDDGEVIKVDVGTREAGLLIGQKGETIDAVQYLLNVIVYKQRSFFKRITVDTEGYRQRRIEALQGMAHRTARRAQRENRPLDLPPMAAAERRVVHMYLKSNPNVSTSSEGQEDDRRVVITPNN